MFWGIAWRMSSPSCARNKQSIIFQFTFYISIKVPQGFLYKQTNFFQFKKRNDDDDDDDCGEQNENLET